MTAIVVTHRPASTRALRRRGATNDKFQRTDSRVLCLLCATCRWPSISRPSSGFGPLPLYRLPPRLAAWDVHLWFEILRAGRGIARRGCCSDSGRDSSIDDGKPKNTPGKARWPSRVLGVSARRRGSETHAGCSARLILRIHCCCGSRSDLPARRCPRGCGVAGGRAADFPDRSRPQSSTIPTPHSDAARGMRDGVYSSSDRPRSAYQASISDMVSSALSAYSNSFKCSSLIMCSLHKKSKSMSDFQ